MVLILVAAGCGGRGTAASRPPLDKMSQQTLELWRRDIEQYRLHTKDPEPLRPEAEEFIETVQLGMLPLARGPEYAEVAETGKKLLERGCRDPLLKSYFGQAVCQAHGAFAAMPILVEALNDWQPSGYPFDMRRVCLFTLVGKAKEYAKMTQWVRLRAEAAKAAAMRVGDPKIAPEMRRVLFYELMPLVDGDYGENWEDAVAIYEACRNVPNADPWIVNMLAGRAHVAKAWHHRGGDWAYKVTDEGWQLFHDNLKKAAKYYAKAGELHPDYPEAASFMISVAMGGESDQSPKDWFEKAKAAQIDFMPSYDKLRWALRPRWGGSHEKIYEFGCKCADTQRYDTPVPFELVRALEDIDAENDQTHKIWLRKGVYERVKKVLEGMANDPSRVGEAPVLPGRIAIKTIHVALAARATRYKDARRLLDELGKSFDPVTFHNWCYHPHGTIVTIYAMSGRGVGDIEEAWKTLAKASKPWNNEVLEQAKSHFQKALAAEAHPLSKAYCRAWISEIDGRLGYARGQWFEKRLDPRFITWVLFEGSWSKEEGNFAVGHPRWGPRRVMIRPNFVPMCPLQVEFDVQVSQNRDGPFNLGFFIPVEGQTDLTDVKYHKFFVRTHENLAGIEIGGKQKVVPCELQPVNHLCVQLSEKRQALYVNGKLCVECNEELHPLLLYNFGCLDSIFPNMKVRVGNIRFRQWDPSKDDVKKEEKIKQSSPGKTT